MIDLTSKHRYELKADEIVSRQVQGEIEYHHAECDLYELGVKAMTLGDFHQFDDELDDDDPINVIAERVIAIIDYVDNSVSRLKG